VYTKCLPKIKVCRKIVCTNFQMILSGKCVQWLYKDQSVSQDGAYSNDLMW